jgi:RNA polymerase sigma factor (sigma-70 family)
VSKSTTSSRRVPDAALEGQMAQHEGLVRWVARQQWRGGLSFDEVRHVGRIGLWHALQSYDPTRGSRFSSYAVPAIARAIWDEVAAASPERFPVLSRLADLVEETDSDEALHQAQVRQTLPALVATLPDRLHDVIVGHYGLEGALPQTFAQIGHRFGVSRHRVHQLHLRALLILAHPVHSHALRLLVERSQRGAYQRTLTRQRQHARTRRRHPR